MPYSSMKDVPKGLKGAGLNLRQANVWGKIYDSAKVGGAYNPAGVAWTAFKKKYKKVGKKWVERTKQLARNPVEKIVFTHWGNEAIGMKPEILAKKMYELSQEYCPNIPIEIATNNMTIGPPKKVKPEEKAFEEEILSNYLGSKKKFVKHIFKFISPNTKTLFDPMCLVPETEILHQNGSSPIEELKLGDSVLTHTGQFKRIQRIFSRDISEKLVEISTQFSNRPVRITCNHPILVIRGSGKKTDRLKKSAIWEKAGNLEQGDFVAFPILTENQHPASVGIHKSHDSRMLRVPQEIKTSANFLRLCGYFISEGFTDANCLLFSNVKFAKEITGLIQNLFNLNPEVKHSSGHFPNDDRIYPKTTIRVNSRALARFFQNNFGQRAENKTIPGWIMSLPKKKLKNFLCGMFNGDGSFVLRTREYKTEGEQRRFREIKYRTKSKCLAFQLRILLSKFRVFPSLICDKLIGSWQIKIYNLPDIKKLGFLSKSFQSLPQIEGYRRYFEHKNLFFSRIKNLRQVSFSGKVFNLQVEEDNSYVAGNFIVHNCGSSHVLIEAAKRGIRVIGNDLSPVAFLYSSGIFQGSKFTDEDMEKFKSFSPVSGWLSNSKLQRPKNPESKKLIDGLVLGSWKKFTEGKRRTALAAMSLLFQHYFRGFQAFIAEEEPYSRKQILGDLTKCVKDINELIEEIGGKGRIFSRNVLSEGIPKADVIYLDPPYFPGGGKDSIKYLNHYYIANSTLMQKTFKPEDPTKEDIVRFLPKLAKSARFLIVSCASPSEIQWERELAKLKRHVKKFQVSKVSTGSQPQGNRANPTVAQSVMENIFCASEKEILPARKLGRVLFKLEGYDPRKINGAQLSDDLGLVAAKYADILCGKKTEFKSKEKCIDFAEKVMEEVLRRGKITFHPEYEVVGGKAKVIKK